MIEIIELKLEIINVHFPHHIREFGHLTSGFVISAQEPYPLSLSLFSPTFSFYPLPHSRKGIFSQRLLESGDVKVAHKLSNYVTRCFV